MTSFKDSELNLKVIDHRVHTCSYVGYLYAGDGSNVASAHESSNEESGDPSAIDNSSLLQSQLDCNLVASEVWLSQPGATTCVLSCWLSLESTLSISLGLADHNRLLH